MPLFGHDFHLRDADFEGLQPQDAQLNICGRGRRHHDVADRQYIIPDKPHHQSVASRRHFFEAKTPVFARKCLLYGILITFFKEKNISVVYSLPVGIIDELPDDAPRRFSGPGREEKYPKEECLKKNFHGSGLNLLLAMSKFPAKVQKNRLG